MPIGCTSFVTRHGWQPFTVLVPSDGGLVLKDGGLVLKDDGLVLKDGVGTKLDSLVGVGCFGCREWLFIDCGNEGC